MSNEREESVGPPGASAGTRAGYVTLVGRPNAGKSTLLNRLVGERLSIVTPKAQTTWRRVTGVLTTGEAQLIFLDTPGLLAARDLLQRAMLGAALEALHEADLVVVVIDATRRPTRRETDRIEAALNDVPESVPLHLALNKVDLVDGAAVEPWRAWGGSVERGAVHEISALEGAGVDRLLEALVTDLPPGPFLYPADYVASDPVRFFVAELVRETVFERYRQEIPYSVVTEVEEYREGQDPVYIGVTVHVERESQKGILVGKGGEAIRALGEASRKKIEHFIGRSVYLDLWVKPLKAWRKNRSHLSRLGFRVPEDDDPHVT